MLWAALGFVAPWSAVPGLLIVLAQTLGGISMFALARRFFSPAAAMFSAACYAGNPYALLVFSMRPHNSTAANTRIGSSTHASSDATLLLKYSSSMPYQWLTTTEGQWSR